MSQISGHVLPELESIEAVYKFDTIRGTHFMTHNKFMIHASFGSSKRKGKFDKVTKMSAAIVLG